MAASLSSWGRCGACVGAHEAWVSSVALLAGRVRVQYLQRSVGQVRRALACMRHGGQGAVAAAKVHSWYRQVHPPHNGPQHLEITRSFTHPPCHGGAAYLLQVYAHFTDTYREAFEASPPKLPGNYTPSVHSFKMLAELPMCGESWRGGGGASHGAG